MPGHYGKMKNGKAKKMAKGKSTRKSILFGLTQDLEVSGCYFFAGSGDSS